MSETLSREDLLAKVLAFAASDEDRLRRFLDWMGLDPETIRDAARAPGFTDAVLEYAQQDDAFARVFGFATGITPDDVARVRFAPPPKPAASKTRPAGLSELARRFQVVDGG